MEYLEAISTVLAIVTTVAMGYLGFRSPMATPNCSTYGRSNCSRQDGSDGNYTGVTAMREAASFNR